MQYIVSRSSTNPLFVRRTHVQDPKFIGRLIGQLDSNMSRMIDDKHKRVTQIEEDTKELARLEEFINSNVQVSMDKLKADLAAKKEVRDRLQKQLDDQGERVKSMMQDATSIAMNARHVAATLRRKMANATLAEARGFTTTIPTTELIKGSRAGSRAGSKPSSPAVAKKPT